MYACLGVHPSAFENDSLECVVSYRLERYLCMPSVGWVYVAKYSEGHVIRVSHGCTPRVLD